MFMLQLLQPSQFSLLSMDAVSRERLYKLFLTSLILCVIYLLTCSLFAGLRGTRRVLDELDYFRHDYRDIGQQQLRDEDFEPPNAAWFVNLYHNNLQEKKVRHFKKKFDSLIPDKVFGSSKSQKSTNSQPGASSSFSPLSKVKAAFDEKGFEVRTKIAIIYDRMLSIPHKFILLFKTGSNNKASKEHESAPFEKQQQQHEVQNKNGVCPICLEKLITGGSLIKELPCKHSYHVECIEQWLFRYGHSCCNEIEFNCPYCRFDVYYYVLNNYDRIKYSSHRFKL